MDISSMLEVQVREMKEEVNIKENVTPRAQTLSTTTAGREPLSQEELNFYQLMFGNDVACVRFRKLHCTACDVHIGSAPSQINNMLEHPMLRTLLCAKCREFYGDGTFEQGDDATDMFCRWCANGGNLYCCSYCSNTFCYKCIRRNFSSLVRKKIEADEKWKCFVCNPSDLYSARAVCWALLQHIQTVTRILKNEKNMSTEEIEEKMNLDESQCCPRRNKRKNKRRLESNSEEEDETYMPKTNGLSIYIKRKQLKKSSNQSKYSTPNGSIITRQILTSPIPIRPRPSSLSGIQFVKDSHVDSQSLFSREPIIVKEQGIEQSEGIVIPSSNMMNTLDDTSLPSRYDPSVLHPTLYHTFVNHTATSSTYIRPPAINSTRQIILPTSPRPPSRPPSVPSSLQVQNSYKSSQPLQPPPNAMVSIPNLMGNLNKSPLLFPMSRRCSNMTVSPNVIELDSDSDDEPKVVDRYNNPIVNESDNIDIVDIPTDKVVPVALVSTENSIDNVKEEQPLREMCTTVKRQPASFNETMLSHRQELDKLLDDIKKKMYHLFVLPEDDAVNKDVESMAHQKMKQFYKNMRNTIFHLADINDRVVREYNKWERSRKKETVPISIEQDTLPSQENIEIPLDMVCVNDSDTEFDCESSEDQIVEPSDFVKASNIIQDLLFSKKDLVHRGVGDSALLSKDKAIQVSDVVSRDYEKCIAHSVLTKADSDMRINDDILKPMEISNKNFGKYEEQFIYYLQHIENHGMETEDIKGLADPNEISLNELIEVNAPYISEFSQNISLSIVPIDQLRNNQEESSMSSIDSIINDKSDVPVSAADEGKKIAQIVDSSKSDTRIEMDPEESQETVLRKTQTNGVTDGEVTSISLNNYDINSSKNTDDAVNTEALRYEEDCTIIDD